MKPSGRVRVAAAITLAKGKMYEFRVPVADHLRVPEEWDLEQQFPFAIGTLGDFASRIIIRGDDGEADASSRDDIIFSAQVFQAFDDSRLRADLSPQLRLFAAASFQLGDVPGSAAVLLRLISGASPFNDDPLATAVRIALDRPWLRGAKQTVGVQARKVLLALREHFDFGGGTDAPETIRLLREWALQAGTAHELLLADVLGAVTLSRIRNSSWTLLPKYSGLTVDVWSHYLRRPNAIKEMWPAQRMLGIAGLYRGTSSVVQMPTSAGKTHALRLMLRAAFLSGRTKLAIVVAPFRALCHEIASDLRNAFFGDDYRVDQLSDSLQSDFSADVSDGGTAGTPSTPRVWVVTPEKLLYVLRQEPKFVEQVGLVVYDEGHQFDTGIRGVTYELLLTSIKRLLPPAAQTVLISAVIQNPAAVASWLLGDQSRVVADSWLQTRRLVAFASLPAGKDGQLQFNAGGLPGEQRFFLPRVIVQEELPKRRGEKTKRVFPTHDSGSIALSLALRLVPNGGIAIYVGTKRSATKIVRDAATDTFARGAAIPIPADSCDGAEIQRFKDLFEENFGAACYLTKAAALGIFAHHGNTPHGIRLAIEHAMREGYIRLIVCTSTLAQGVNLPIRYLLVTSSSQGRDAIKPRDFHNLMGRAGRAGMYGEGTVVFTDPALYDGRLRDSRRWEATTQLLRAESAEPTGSTLLELLEPMKNDYGTRTVGKPTPYEVAAGLIDDRERVFRLFSTLPLDMLRVHFSVDALRRQLEVKRATIEAIESFLMTYRGETDSDSFVLAARVLAQETLAFSLASVEQRQLLENLFERIARRIEQSVPDVGTQFRYGRTLMGVEAASTIDSWVGARLPELSVIASADELFDAIWPLLILLCTERRVTAASPTVALKEFAVGWLAGATFEQLLDGLTAAQARYPFGKLWRAFDADVVVDICEQTFGYAFTLVIAAVRNSFEAAIATKDTAEAFARNADLLQKRLRYGLPTQDSVAYFEAGFAERVAAQAVATELWWEDARTAREARALIKEHADEISSVVRRFPSYFDAVLKGIVGSSA